MQNIMFNCVYKKEFINTGVYIIYYGDALSFQNVMVGFWSWLCLFQNALTPTVAADLVTMTDVLKNETLLVSYLSKVELQNITAFLTALTSSAARVSNSDPQTNVYELKDDYNIYRSRIILQEHKTLVLGYQFRWNLFHEILVKPLIFP